MNCYPTVCCVAFLLDKSGARSSLFLFCKIVALLLKAIATLVRMNYGAGYKPLWPSIICKMRCVCSCSSYHLSELDDFVFKNTYQIYRKGPPEAKEEIEIFHGLFVWKMPISIWKLLLLARPLATHHQQEMYRKTFSWLQQLLLSKSTKVKKQWSQGRIDRWHT